MYCWSFPIKPKFHTSPCDDVTAVTPWGSESNWQHNMWQSSWQRWGEAGQQNRGRAETERKGQLSLVPTRPAALAAHLEPRPHHWGHAGPESPSCQLPHLCKQDAASAGLAQSAARRRRYCQRLTQNLLPLLFTFDRVKPCCLENETEWADLTSSAWIQL